MKRISTLMLCIIAFNAFTFAVNLVTNPGFEDDRTVNTIFTGGQYQLLRTTQFWDDATQVNYPTAPSAVDISTGGIWVKRAPATGYIRSHIIDSDAHSGAQCVQVYIPSGASSTYNYWYHINATQRLTTPLLNTKIYKASVWAKADATEGNACADIVIALTDGVLHKSYSLIVPLTGGTTWTKYEVTFDLPSHIAKSGNETADFSVAIFSVGTRTTLNESNTTNYSGVLLDDFSIEVDTSTFISNVPLDRNVLLASNQQIRTKLDGKLEVFNLSGSKLISKDIKTGDSVSLPSGLYLIKLTATEGVFQQKVIL